MALVHNTYQLTGNMWVDLVSTRYNQSKARASHIINKFLAE